MVFKSIKYYFKYSLYAEVFFFSNPKNALYSELRRTKLSRETLTPNPEVEKIFRFAAYFVTSGQALEIDHSALPSAEHLISLLPTHHSPTDPLTH